MVVLNDSSIAQPAAAHNAMRASSTTRSISGRPFSASPIAASASTSTPAKAMSAVAAQLQQIEAVRHQHDYRLLIRGQFPIDVAGSLCRLLFRILIVIRSQHPVETNDLDALDLFRRHLGALRQHAQPQTILQLILDHRYCTRLGADPLAEFRVLTDLGERPAILRASTVLTRRALCVKHAAGLRIN
jgi:hypothetical protein